MNSYVQHADCSNSQHTSLLEFRHRLNEVNEGVDPGGARMRGMQ